MAWTNLTFSFGSLLTSSKMTQLDSNLDALAAGLSGAPNIATAAIIDLNVTTAKLAANAVTTAKILNANVTLAKLASAVSSLILNAWVTVTSTGTITDSVGVSSVTDGGTGILTVNWSTAFGNSDYAVTITAELSLRIASITASTTTSTTIHTFNTGGTLINTNIKVMAIGD